jgi:hypothetical protein
MHFRFPASIRAYCFVASALTVVVFSMGSVNLVVIVESVQSLITSNGELKEFHIPSIVSVGAALGEHRSICMVSYSWLIIRDRC